MDYRKRAAKCVELAAQISDPICKAAFLEMARSWAHLAEQADKTARSTLRDAFRISTRPWRARVVAAVLRARSKMLDLSRNYRPQRRKPIYLG